MAAGFDLRRHQQQTQISCATKTVFNCFKAPRANDEPHCPRAEHATTKSPQEYGRGGGAGCWCQNTSHKVASAATSMVPAGVP